MPLIQATETTYLGLFLKDGQLQTVRFRQATVVKDSDTGKEIARNEGDEQALPDGSEISGLLGDGLSAALASNAAMAQQITALEEQLANQKADLNDAQSFAKQAADNLGAALSQIAALKQQLAAMAAPPDPAPAAPPADSTSPEQP